jgi:phosphoglycolate phosphatase-like HAD superfamily hydrolase
MGQVSSYDIVVFDMEDALVDRSTSECAAVSEGIDAYLTSLVGVKPEGGPVFTPEEVKAFIEAQGFDADVDVLTALLSAALHVLSVEVSEDEYGVYDGREMLEAVRNGGLVTDSLGDIKARKNVPEFAKMLRQKGGGKKALGRVRGLRNRWLVLSEGHIMMDNFVQRVLAEAYLGDELFHKQYGQDRHFVKQEGTIGLERSWIDPRDIGDVRKRCSIAAVTSRSQLEAQHVLGRIELAPFIDVVVSQGSMGMGMADEAETTWIRDLGVGGGVAADYTTRVTEAIERVRAQGGLEQALRIAYVGNVAPESRGIAALKDRYRLTAIGCAFGQDRKLLQVQKEKGADHVVQEPAQILRVLSERPRMRGPEHQGY